MKTEHNPDFEAFKADITWFINPNSKVKFSELENIRLSEEFKSTFPELTELLLHIEMDGGHAEFNQKL